MNKLAIIANIPTYGIARVTIVDGLIEWIEVKDFKPQDADLFLPECALIPGLIDLQINGCLGQDFTQNPESIFDVAKHLPRWGCTAFLPTIITSEFEAYPHKLEIVTEAMHTLKGARVLGAHLEGPFINVASKGAHEAAYLRSPSIPDVAQLMQAGSLRMLTLAPELPGALEVIQYLMENGIIVCAGHTKATYEEGQAAFLAGVNYMTHTFNAMPGIHHRSPGIIVAALDTAQRPFMGVIADGIHVHPAILRLIGDAPLTLVTDAMAGMGMPPGRYKLAGLDVIVDETSARLNDGKQTLAGSILTLDQAVRNAMEFLHIPLEKAVTLASYNPAQVLNCSGEMGQVAQGYKADLVLLDRHNQVHTTLVGGQIVYQRED